MAASAHNVLVSEDATSPYWSRSQDMRGVKRKLEETGFVPIQTSLKQDKGTQTEEGHHSLYLTDRLKQVKADKETGRSRFYPVSGGADNPVGVALDALDGGDVVHEPSSFSEGQQAVKLPGASADTPIVLDGDDNQSDDQQVQTSEDGAHLFRRQQLEKGWSWPPSDDKFGENAVLYQYVLTPNKDQSDTRVFRLIATKNGLMYDFREYVKGVPTTNGVRLPPQRFVNLLSYTDHIDEHVMIIKRKSQDSQSYKTHVGGNLYVTMGAPYRVVHLRDYWLRPGASEVQPTRRGCGLRFSEWDTFKTKCVGILRRIEPSLTYLKPCLEREDHANQLGYLTCSECNPNFGEN